MNNNLLQNVALALGQDGGLVLACLVLVAWGGLLVFAYLKKAAAERFTDVELAALALSGWPLPALLLSLSILLLRLILPAVWVNGLVLGMMLVTGGMALRGVWGRFKSVIVLPLLFFLFFLLLRIGYVAAAVLPAYFDSPEHYRIIQALLDVRPAWPTDSYYHLGYHILTAGFVAFTGADIARVMLVFGQVIVAAMPLPMYVFVRRVTGSERAAFLAVVFAGIGWFVPAHAVNWGKYPALLGMLVFQFTLGLALLDLRKAALAAAVFAVSIHTRMAVLPAVCLAAWLLMTRPKLGWILSLGILGVLGWRYQDLGALWGAYGNGALLLAALLAGLSIRTRPRLVAGSVFAILIGLALTVLPPAFPILDRPLTEMLLSLPLAFLGGLGAARLPKWSVALLAVVLLAHALTMYSFAPSDCCQLAGRDDMAAMQWIEKNTPEDAIILIARADYSLGGATLYGMGTDAGMWITPLTGHVTPALPYATDFSQFDSYRRLCWGEVSYVYVGNRDVSFNLTGLQSNPAWYRSTFSLPTVTIIQVLGCPAVE
ncbi:MAG: hypothetical protein HY869_19820 [Chloroflexi bacterium]|nr:hypothetical protein [Chloroflexota bacterium]